MMVRSTASGFLDVTHGFITGFLGSSASIQKRSSFASNPYRSRSVEMGVLLT